MTDKQIIETIKRIKIHCHRLHLQAEIDWSDPCSRCEFWTEHRSKRNNVCQITNLLGNMTCEPRYWNLPRIEEIIKGETDESNIGD